jgi:hypothetical protein
MVRVLTSPFISSVKAWVHHGGCVKHCIDVLDMCDYLLAVLRQQGCELIDDDPGGQGVVCRRAVNLLTLPLNLVEFFVECPRSVPESLSTRRSLPVEHGVVSPKATPSSASPSDPPESSCQPWCPFLVALSATRANQADRAISSSASLTISTVVRLGDLLSSP